jgi:hypothetical protein
VTSFPAQLSGEDGDPTNWNGSFRDFYSQGWLTGTGRVCEFDDVRNRHSNGHVGLVLIELVPQG